MGQAPRRLGASPHYFRHLYELSRTDRQQARFWTPVAMAMAAVAGVFVAAVLALLVLLQARRPANDPLDSKDLQDMKSGRQT